MIRPIVVVLENTINPMSASCGHKYDNDGHFFLADYSIWLLWARKDVCLHKSADFAAWIDTTSIFWDCQCSFGIETLNDEDTVEPWPCQHDVDELVEHSCVRGSRTLIGTDRGVAVIHSSLACSRAIAEGGGFAEIAPANGLVLPLGRP